MASITSFYFVFSSPALPVRRFGCPARRLALKPCCERVFVGAHLENGNPT